MDACTRAESCSAPTFVGGTCEEQCARLVDLADAAGCEDETSDFFACANDAADVCELEQSCTSEAMSYYLCVSPYCEANPNADECRGFTCSYSGGGSGQSCHVTAQCTGGPEYELDCVDGTCTCRQDGQDVGTASFDATFCDGDLDAAVAAAMASCGWQL